MAMTPKELVHAVNNASQVVYGCLMRLGVDEQDASDIIARVKEAVDNAPLAPDTGFRDTGTEDPQV